ncbi:hypothetical protein GCM10027048_34240 [Hymenobacter coalescens]
MHTPLPHVPTPTSTGRPRFGWALLLGLLLGGTSAWAQAPLSGAYTINNAQPTGGTNFASFGAAATALNTNGVSGPVTITVSGGPYTEQISLSALTGTSATNRVTINGGGSKIQFGSNTSAQRAVITLNGADFVTLNNLQVDATESGASTATYGWGIQLLNNADNNVISNCTITSSPSSTSSTNFLGIVANNSTTSPTTGGAAGTALTVENNTIVGGYYGIKLVGTSSNLLSGYRIRENIIQDFHNYGIDADYTTGAQIIANNISRPTRTAVGAFYGVSLGAGNANTDIEKNRIHNPFTGNTAATGIAYGISISGDDPAVGAENEVINNLIYSFDGAGTEYGLYNSSSNNVRYYHNTVVLDNTASASASDSYGFYQVTTATGIELRNNVLVVRRGGSGDRYALGFATTTSTISSNYNDLVVGSGSTSYTGRYGTANFATLADWKGANSAAYDQNSVDADPAFAGAAPNNYRPTASPLNNAGTPLARVTDDITGATRGAAPDLGAYEFAPAADDVAVVSIDSPASPVVPGAGTVTVTILNNGGSPLNSVRLEYTLNGAAAVGQTFTLAGGLAPGATRVLTFTTTGTLRVGANPLTVTASLPNGNADSNPSNNTQTTTLYTSMAGTYTIDKTQPTGGTNFASFTDAANRLNGGGITASVRLNVLNGPYTDQFLLGVVPGVSATDTIVVDGGTASQTLSYTGAVGVPSAVQLNGTDYVTLQNLTIDASAGTTFGIGVHLVGQANHNRITNCVIRGSATSTTSTASAGIAASGTVASGSDAGDASNLRIENNVISGGYYGIILTGASTTNRSTGIRVIGNEVRDFYGYGVDVENSAGARIIGNNVHRPTRTASTTTYGIYLVGDVSAAVENNRVHDLFTANAASTSAAYGIYTSGDAAAGTENDVVNNLVYNFNGAGTEYGLYNTGANFARYYHNTVSLDNTAATSASLSYGFYQTTQASGIELRNNLISVTRGGSGARYAIYLATTTSTVVSDYNDLFVGTGSNYYTGRFGSSTTTGLNFATLANWKTANNNAYDQNSVQLDPLFTGSSLVPTNVQLNGTGSPTTLARVPRDFAGTTRNTPPDPGAYELTLIANDVAVVSIDAPTTPAVLGSNPVVVTIRNGGTAVLNSVTLSYSLNNGSATPQTFTGLNLAAGATRQLTFTTGVVLAQSGTFTLTVTGSLPNGQADGNASNNTQTTTFDQPMPANDEPCAAVAIGAGVSGSNSGASTSLQNGITLPACSPSMSPKDVWFTFTATGATTPLYLSGDAAGMVRVFSSASCANGPFTQVFCASSGTANTSVGTVTVTGLTNGQQYYVAVSGYATNDTPGTFRISTTPLSSRVQTKAAALAVYPNPSATGQLTVRLTTLTGAGTVELLNALGQSVRRQALQGAGEHHVSTRGLAAGVYTLRVQAGQEIVSRKVVLQ